MTRLYNNSKFNFQRNQWLFFYLRNFVFSNKSIKSLEDVKELSIELLESIFRKKGFSKHKKNNWLLCAESNNCSSECRDSNGFKTEYEKRSKSLKCVPKTRKLNPNVKNKNYLNYNSDYQYAYLFLKNYNSIIYTLNEYNKQDLKEDEILKLLSIYSDNNQLTSITNAYDIYKKKEYIALTKKIERFYPKIKERRNNSTFKSHIPSIMDYESAFDKREKEIIKESQNKTKESQNKTKKTGGKRNKTKKRRSSFFIF